VLFPVQVLDRLPLAAFDSNTSFPRAAEDRESLSNLASARKPITLVPIKIGTPAERHLVYGPRQLILIGIGRPPSSGFPSVRGLRVGFLVGAPLTLERLQALFSGAYSAGIRLSPRP